MFTLDCPDCAFTATADTETEALEQAFTHQRSHTGSLPHIVDILRDNE